MKGPYSILLAGKGNMMQGVSSACFGNLLVRMVIDVYTNTVKFRKQAPPCINPSKYKPPEIKT